MPFNDRLDIDLKWLYIPTNTSLRSQTHGSCKLFKFRWSNILNYRLNKQMVGKC